MSPRKITVVSAQLLGFDRRGGVGPATTNLATALAENSPNVVYECLEAGVPFLASSEGGTGELVAEPRVVRADRRGCVGLAAARAR